MWLLCTGQPSCGKTTLVKKALDRINNEWQSNSDNDDDKNTTDDRKKRAPTSSSYTHHHQNIAVSGFYTDEVLDGSGRRIGFDIVGIASKKRGVLSRKSGLPSNFPKTGQYSVDVASFEDIALVELDIIESQTSSAVTEDSDVTDDDRTSQIIIIDEIGRMELHSTKFQAAVEKLLHQPHVLVIGAITSAIYGHRVPFCDYITDGYKLKKHPMPVEVMRIKQSTRESVTIEYLQRLDALLLKSLEGDRKRRKRGE